MLHITDRRSQAAAPLSRVQVLGCGRVAPLVLEAGNRSARLTVGHEDLKLTVLCIDMAIIKNEETKQKNPEAEKGTLLLC